MSTHLDEAAAAPWLAVVGAACRFPGAAGPEEFWENLAQGVESVRALGARRADGHQPACGVVDDADHFDAAFFGYSPREALLLDPQHRVMLETSWAALEDAGHHPAAFPGMIGVYAGSTQTRYPEVLLAQRHRLPGVSEFQIRVATGLDHLTTRVAYKLGLTGPAVTVQTACSTSLVAIHLAAQALLAGDCDLALAGGVTVHVPAEPGEYTAGGIIAADGHCRAFDAAADGTVGGDGAGVVVLRRLEDALAAGDTVRAVLRGTAVNNDGHDKIGFTAPSVTGQARAVRAALRAAEVDPDTIGYVEAHGTGTPLGDPIEVAALTEAFAGDGRRGACLLGSVKTNIGHTDAAAGVAGFLKATLALQHRAIPASLHFTTPNPALGLESGPFRVASAYSVWEAGDGPRRAAVNSLGIGGTNAHAVLEEAPEPVPGSAGRPQQLLVLSATSRTALEEATTRLAIRLRRDAPPLADVAWTLQTGRRAHRHRRFVVASTPDEAADRLTGGSAVTATATDPAPRVVFLYPGQGGQHPGMAAGLYRHEPAFAAAVDECAELAAPGLGVDLRSLLYQGGADGSGQLATMAVGQVAVFVVEYALTRLWESWGVRPGVVLGHSLGAYAAACAAGIFGLADAIGLLMRRGRLLGDLAEGAMLAVQLPEEAVTELLGPDLWLATVNAADQCVVSGPVAAIDRLAGVLAGRDVDSRRLRIPAGAHSGLVEPVLARFEKDVAALDLHPPRLPWVSDSTGTWGTAAEATDPAYWRAHLRRPVRFADALSTVLSTPDQLLLEVGPGRTLIGLARRHPALGGSVTASSLPHPTDTAPDLAVALAAAGRLWAAGTTPDWSAMHRDESRRRVPLPTYPFQRSRYLVEGPAGTSEPVDRGPLVLPELPRDDDVPAYVAPSTPEQTAVCATFGDVLGLARVGVHDDFFELGGDSLIALQLVSRLRRDHAVTITARQVFAAPTPALLARLIDRLPASAATAEKEQ